LGQHGLSACATLQASHEEQTMTFWRTVAGRRGRRPAGAILAVRSPAAVLGVDAAMLAWAALAAGTGMDEVPADLPAIFRGADLPLGERLLAEHRCSACHSQRVGGDGSDIYNPAGRIASPGALRGMVEYCNTDLRLQLFPDEVTAIAAVLNRDHYHFR
jgi:hypothetical protein